MTARKSLAVAAIAFVAILWPGPHDERGGSGAGAQAAAAHCGGRPPGRRMVDVRYADEGSRLVIGSEHADF